MTDTSVKVVTIISLSIGIFGTIMMIISPGNDLTTNIVVIFLIIAFLGMGSFHGYDWLIKSKRQNLREEKQ